MIRNLSGWIACILFSRILYLFLTQYEWKDLGDLVAASLFISFPLVMTLFSDFFAQRILPIFAIGWFRGAASDINTPENSGPAIRGC